MNFNTIIDIVNHKLLENHNSCLNSTEIIILRGIWQGQTYKEIAKKEGYSSGYFTNVVAPELFRKLSELIGKDIKKNNCRQLLESHIPTPIAGPSYPSGPLPLSSPFYIQRQPIEQQIAQEIRKPGALVRIKAPREMGKTSLLLRVIDSVHRQGYRTVTLNLEQVDRDILNDLNRFLRCFCATVTSQLDLEAKLDDYWDEDIGSKISCTLYFQTYLLQQIEMPILLALDELNQIFEYPQIARDFLPLLRSWYEEGKRLPIWQKLRLIVSHSTEVYVPLQLKQSPFNVGFPVQLKGFCMKQVEELARRYGQPWKNDSKEARELMAIIGGHPALVHIAIYHLSQGEITLPQLLREASSCSGIYSSHLQRHQVALEQERGLEIALRAVLSATEPVLLEPIIAYKLSSMGLIELDNNKATPSFQLYRQYFNRCIKNIYSS